MDIYKEEHKQKMNHVFNVLYSLNFKCCICGVYLNDKIYFGAKELNLNHGCYVCSTKCEIIFNNK
jgi:hypothetical protein